MSRVLQPITACLKKGEIMENNEDHLTYDKRSENEKTNEIEEERSGLIWRMSSRLYNLGSGAVGLGVNLGSGAVGLGVGSVKWAASTTYTVGSGVVSATQTVVAKVVPSAVPKPKKE